MEIRSANGLDSSAASAFAPRPSSSVSAVDLFREGFFDTFFALLCAETRKIIHFSRDATSKALMCKAIAAFVPTYAFHGRLAPPRHLIFSDSSQRRGAQLTVDTNAHRFIVCLAERDAGRL
jgi:hypothetical protein